MEIIINTHFLWFDITSKFFTFVAPRTDTSLAHFGISLALSIVWHTCSVSALSIPLYEVPGLPPKSLPPICSLVLSQPQLSYLNCSNCLPPVLLTLVLSTNCTTSYICALFNELRKLWDVHGSLHIVETQKPSMAQYILSFKDKGRCSLKFSHHLRQGNTTSKSLKVAFSCCVVGLGPHIMEIIPATSSQTKQRKVSLDKGPAFILLLV